MSFIVDYNKQLDSSASVCFESSAELIIDQITLFRHPGTSNWAGDYFLTTAGVSLVISQHAPHPEWKNKTLHGQLKEVFDRDWNSEFAVHLADLGHNPDCALSK